MRKGFKKAISVIVVLVMVISCMPAVLASNGQSHSASLMAGTTNAERGTSSSELEGVSSIVEQLGVLGDFEDASDEDYAVYNDLLNSYYSENAAENKKNQSAVTLDYTNVDNLFAKIEKMEDAPEKKGVSQKNLSDAAQAIVLASEGYVEGSLDRDGNTFTWMTEEGIRCIYDPRMRQIEENMVKPEEPFADGAYNEPTPKKGGSPTSNQVYLIAPYYGYDDSFTNQYKNEATNIASAIGDTDGYTLYSGYYATVDRVADAVSNGAVVIFDSHGATDYSSGDDYVTGAEYSYLCLQTSTGLTSADYADGAAYGGGTAYINGETIANHMSRNSPSGILWMAICLGMATDTLCQPMRNMGVEVVYGYSQSVTFAGDYCFESTFWDNMLQGDTVAEAISDMKSRWGEWDWSTQIASYYYYNDGYASISTARSNYAAFPVVVSNEDAHPGQRSRSSYGACSRQTVRSTYVLLDGTVEPDPTEPDPTVPSDSVVEELQSAHPYSGNTDQTWYYTHPTAADSLDITFSNDTQTESGYDHIYIYDANGVEVGMYSGTLLAGQTVTVPGNQFSIRLVSDGSVNKYGFRVVSVIANGITVSDVSQLQSAHPYQNNEDYIVEYYHETQAGMLEVTFSEDTKTESNYDYIYIYDMEGNLVGQYSGTQLSGKTVTVNGSYFMIRLTSDGSTNAYGFRVTSVVAREAEEIPSNYQKLRNYIHNYGSTLDDGTEVWLVWDTVGEFTRYFVLHNEENGILFNFLMVSSESTAIELMHNFLLDENSWYLDATFIVEYYYNGYRVDWVEAEGYLEKNTITTDTEIIITVNSPYLITSDMATDLATPSFQSLCLIWDSNIYSKLGFGLRGLGFTSYDGYGSTCSHSYSNSCDGICNNCGQMRLITHSYGSHICTNEDVHSRACRICDMMEYTYHNWDRGVVVQQPTEDTSGVIKYTCGDCGYSKNVTVDAIAGDFDSDGVIDNKDVEYLLWHTLFPEDYPITAFADFDSDGTVDNKDVEYLLWHTLFPEDYPLQ